MDILDNKLILSGISLILGAFIKTLFDKIMNKTKIIYYYVNSVIRSNSPEWEC